MNIHCKLCEESIFNADGRAVGDVMIFQRVEGIFHLAITTTLALPYIFIHSKCLKEVTPK